ncbi:uncharacterized protein At4g00950-like [Actinidia eriantha]|uniref:uncharacterized protein At4g00950-like n=1 Tax=Actinidia eriantha TaxID=165200 RepID=UPI00258661F9|nr:uncharacterized protein At4g00950-like [Actinidia eriantha]
MGTEEEPEPSSTPKLPLLSLPPIKSPEPSGTLTPPLYTSASVPFRWEEEPGKPRPSTALLLLPTTTTKGLELPPRLQSMDSKMTKIPSPTTVLEGPDMPLFQSSSFRFTRERQGSFGSSCGSPEGGQFGSPVVLSKTLGSKGKGRLFGSWRRKPTLKRGKKDVVVGGSSVFSSSLDLVDFGDDESGSAKGKNMARVSRNGSFSSLSQVRPHFWETIYEGFKQVLPWKCTKSRKDPLII